MRSLEKLLESVRFADDVSEPARDFAELAVPTSADPFWSDAARKLVAAVVVYVGRDTGYSGPRTLDGVAAVLSMRPGELSALPGISERRVSEKEWASVVSVARSGFVPAAA